MISSRYKNYRRKKKSKDLIKFCRSVLKSKRSVIDTQVATDAEKKISELEDALNTGNNVSIETNYNDLKKFSEDHLNKYTKSRLRQNVESIVIALGLALLIRTFVIQPFKIPSGSMIPTLLVGDHLLVNKFIYGTKIPFTNTIVLPFEKIHRGDVIVFIFPDHSENGPQKGVHYIKRVIGVAGDKIDIRDNNVYVNGEKVPQKYIGEYTFRDNGIEMTSDMYRDSFKHHNFRVIYKNGSTATTKGNLNFPITVPKNTVFCMGDNRDNSYDSRFWGFVPIHNISGKAFLIHWSWNFDSDNIFKMVRWNRIFTTIK